MMESMTGPDEHPADEVSVLSSLPATRPQRRSPKRAAAAKPDDGARPDEGAQPDEGAPDQPTPATKPRPRPPRARRRPAASASTDQAEPAGPEPDTRHRARQPATPPAAQGFQADPIHGSVNPPTGGELLASVAHGASELVGIGLDLTRRIARSVFDRLPGF
jgi:hypothetical protein